MDRRADSDSKRVLSGILVLLFISLCGWVAGPANAEPATAKADPKNPYNVSLLGRLGGISYAVAVQVPFAYLGEGKQLAVYNVSDPAAPVRVAGLDMDNYVTDIVVSGGIAYVAEGMLQEPQYPVPRQGALVTVDISTPSAPRVLGKYVTTDYAVGVAVSSGVAGVITIQNPLWKGTFPKGTSTVLVLDVNDPSDVRLRAAYTPRGYAMRVAAANGMLYIVGYDPELEIVDVTNPDSPSPRGAYSGPLFMMDIVVSGATAYGASAFNMASIDETGGVIVYNVANPDHPVEVGAWTSDQGVALAMTIANQMAYLAWQGSSSVNPDGLKIVDLHDPAHPSEAGTSELRYAGAGVAVADSNAYVAALEGGLNIVNVANPALPVALGRTVGVPETMAVAERLAALASANQVWLADVSMPQAPVLRGMFAVPNGARSVALAARKAYVVGGTDLRIFDVSDPAAPSLLGVYDGLGDATGIAMRDSLAFVADGAHLRVLDVSQPDHPSLVATRDTSTAVTSVKTAPGRAIVYGNTDLAFYDVTEPTNPTVLMEEFPGVPVADVAISSDKAYVDVQGMLLIVDLADPNNYVITPAVGLGMHLDVWGNYLYTNGSAYYPGFNVYDLRYLIYGLQIGQYWLPDPEQIVALGSQAFVVDRWDGLNILQFTNQHTCDTEEEFGLQGEALAAQAMALNIDANGDGVVNATDTVWDNWDLDRDGLPDRYEVALLAYVGCVMNYPFLHGVIDAYRANVDAFAMDNLERARQYGDVIAALITVSADSHAALRAANVISSDIPPYQAYTGGKSPAEPLSGTGDLDHDGVSNVQEYENVMAHDGTLQDFIFAVTTPWANGDPLPASGIFALTAMGAILLLAGGRALNRDRH